MECDNEILPEHGSDISERDPGKFIVSPSSVCISANMTNVINQQGESDCVALQEENGDDADGNDKDDLHGEKTDLLDDKQTIPDIGTSEYHCIESCESSIPFSSSAVGGNTDDGGLRKCERHSSPLFKQKMFFCGVCHKSFNRKSNMIVHEKIHSAEPRVKSFVCSVCDKAFGTKSNLHCHIRIHTGEKPFQCPMCDKAFTVSSSLHSHIRIHTGERPYVCDVCGKGFTECSQLQKHRRNHTGERPYKCQVCDGTFTQKSSLDSHMKMHTGDKPFKCSVCNKVCRTSSEVQVHMRTHTGERPYKCSVCDVAFSRPDSVEKHMRTHTGEKPYICVECNKSFTVSSALHRHFKTHTGEKPYKCTFCDKTFGESGNLNKHMRKIHKYTGDKSNCDIQSGNLPDKISTGITNSNNVNIKSCDQVSVLVPPDSSGSIELSSMSIPVFPGNDSFNRLYTNSP